MTSLPPMSPPSRWSIIFRYVSLLAIFVMSACGEASSDKTGLLWITIPPLPPAPGDTVQLGIAGPVTGIIGEKLLVAGGANFPDGLPWQGGRKVYHKDIYILENQRNSLFSWTVSPVLLPARVAYAACVNLPDGFLVIGGENENGPLDQVLRITNRKGELNIQQLPSLPEAISAAGTARIGSKIYLAGGMAGQQASPRCYCLDISDPDTGWIRLPDMPLPLSHSVVVAQEDDSGRCLYVLGGRYRRGDQTVFSGAVWKYRMDTDRWIHDSEISPNGEATVLSAGMGIASGAHSIILFGGDQGVLFRQLEQLSRQIETAPDTLERARLVSVKDSILNNHPGFNGRILVYDTRTHQWSVAGEMPGPAPVTTAATIWNELVVIPSGEIRPGVRTSRVLAVEIKN